ncbi:MAG: PAS domain S-box-containing protein, partial [Pseudohongiellaceae bacterium]
MQPATAGGFVFAGLAVVAQCLSCRRFASLFGALAAGLTSVVMADEVLTRPSALLDLVFLRGQGGSMSMAPVTVLAMGVSVSLLLVFWAPGVRGLWRQATEGVLAALLLACGVIGLLPGDREIVPLGMDLRSAVTFAALGVAFFVMIGKYRGGSLRRPIPDWAPWVAGSAVGILVVGLWVGLTTDEERWIRESKSHVRVNVVDRTRWALSQHGKDLKQLGALLVNAGSSHGLLDVYLSHLPAIRTAWMLDGSGDVKFSVGDEAQPFPGDLPEVSRIVDRCRVDNVMSVSRMQDGKGQADRLFACIPLEGEDCLLVEQDIEELVLAALPSEGPRVLNVQVNKGKKTLFESGPPVLISSAPAPFDEFAGQVSYGDQLWDLSGAVRRTSMAGDRAASNTLVLWIGLFLAVSTAFAVRKSELGRQRSVSLEQANATIEDQFVSLNEANERLEEKALHLTAVQQRLSRAAQEKRRVLDSLSAFLIGVDGDGFVVEWNQVSCEVFGLGADEAVGRVFVELDIPWDQGSVNDAIAEARASSRRVLRDLFTVARPDGDEDTDPRLVSFTINPTQERGRRGFALIGADVTERQMLQVQLHASRKLESVGTLAAGIAHEINT